MYVYDVSIINSTFLNNNAPVNSVFYIGSYEEGSILTIKDSNFINNTGEYAHGVGEAYISNIIVTNSSFSNNNAADGPVGVVSFSSDNLTIKDSIFENNTALYDYGVMSIWSSNLNISNSSFINNHVLDGNYGVFYSMGGGSGGGDLTIVDSVFINNSAGKSFGAIHVTNYILNIISNSSFINNHELDGDYGVIYVYGVDDTSNVSLTIIADSVFINNSASQSFGAIHVMASNVNITNTNFINNTAIEGEGGALYCYLYDASLFINNSTFISNSAYYSGGALWISAVYISINDSVFLNNGVFYNNSANPNNYLGGGAIWAESNSFNLSDSNFTDNFDYTTGGALEITLFDYIPYLGLLINKNLLINNTIFSNNSANSGGAIHMLYLDNYWDNSFMYNSLNMYNSTFTNNSANGAGGGALYIDTEDDEISLNITTSNFINNMAIGYQGGDIYSTAHNLTISNSNFIGSTDSEAGGIYTSGDYTSIFHSNFTLTNLPIYFDGNYGTLYGSNVFNNNLPILINNGIEGTNISYNRIFNNTNKQESDIDLSTYDLEDNGTDYVLDYNWWGDNTPSIIANGNPFTPDKYFVVGITNATDVGSDGIALFNYTFGLNDNSSGTGSELPYFVTDVWVNVTSTGSVEVFSLSSFDPTGLTYISSFDARENGTIAVELNINAPQEVEFTFVTDNEVNTLDLFIDASVNDTIILNGENGTYHTNISINATLSNSVPISNKNVSFYIDVNGDFNGTGTADLVFIGTGITNNTGFVNITYLVNYTGNYSIFAFAFDSDNTTILAFNTTNLSFYPQNATIIAYNNTTSVGVYPTLIANVTGQVDGQLEGIKVNFIVNSSVVGSSITNSNGIAIFTYANTDFSSNFTYSVELDNGNYSAVNSSAEVFINKSNVNLNITVPPGSVGQVINITLNLTNLANNSYLVDGLFNVSAGEVNYTNVNFVNGLANVFYQIIAPISNLNVTVSGNNYYNSNNTNAVVNFTKANLGINVTVPRGSVGQVINVSLNLTNLANNSYFIDGLFNVSVGEVNYTNVNFTNGLATVSYQITTPGSNLNVSISGNNYYNSNYTIVNGLVLNSTLFINPIPDTKMNSSVSINGTLLDEKGAPISGVTVNLTVNNVNYNATTDASGKWNITYNIVSTGVINIVAEFIGNTNHAGAANSTHFDGLALNSTLVINPVTNTKLNSSVSINGTLLDKQGAPISGIIVKLTVNGVTYNVTTDASGKWNIIYRVVSTSVINIAAEFIGNDNYTAATNTTYFNGLALNSTLVINPVTNTKINSNITINGTLLDDKGAPISSATVNLTVNNVSYNATTDASGNWNITYHVVSTSVINIAAEFIGNDNYTAAANTTYFNGVALNSALIINLIPSTNVNSSVSINGSLLDEKGAPISDVTVVVTVNGVNYNTTTDVSGKWNIIYLVNSKELVNVVGEFIGNDNYTAAANRTYFNGAALNSTLIINPIPDTKINSNISINGSLFDENNNNNNNNTINNVTVVVTVNGVNYNTTTDASGKWNINYPVNSTGNINIVAEFNGNTNHTAAANSTNFNGVSLNSKLVINPVPDAKMNSNVSINGTLLDENNKAINNVTVVVTVNGVNYNTTTYASGKWNINYPVNSTGNINIVAEFNGNTNHTAAANSTNFNGVSLNSKLVINPVPDAKMNSNVSINGTLLDENNKAINNVTVVVTVNGVNYNTTTYASGNWGITYLVKSSGNINVVAEFNGNTNYATAVNSTTFNGLPLNSTLVINPVSGAKMNSSISINGTLLDENNNAISNVRIVVTVNGVNYNTTTDVSGKWNINYPVNSTDLVNIVAVFNGNDRYVSATNSTTFIVPNNVNISIIKIASINGINNSANAHFGDTIIYTISVMNNGVTITTGVLVTEIINNTKLKLNKTSATQGYYNNTNGLWTIGEIIAGKTVTLTINVTIIAIGNISNSANVSVSENNTNSNNKTTVNISVNDVNISMVMVSNVTEQNNPHYDDIVTYKITITNNGITDGHGVNITDILGNKLKFINYTTTDESIYDKNTEIWSIGTLKAGNNITLIITARINDIGEIENVAKINTNESNINNKTNSSIKFTVNDVNLTIVKTSNITESPLVKDYITYTIKITNNGLNTASNFNVLGRSSIIH
ncbi:beta strand repeat-containing protein [Methanobrevibacter filiformis]|uniref:DUF11 domain-containing protein n=1 Tax=Methanobrevibacter filiformis TaxID=55758 RepID=A0A165YZI0_9EURY|nr:DUF11 domain-containing protein [Methanobrevibacter filiformis]KZX10062.1 hypothetical protein MBFIL_19160 [Methanobrevibacter filiformis]